MPYEAETLIIGCGNLLFKDDGFGPFVIQALEKHFENKEMPESTMFIDAGTAAPYYIFSLPEEIWKKIIVVDIIMFGAEPGTLRFFTPDEIPETKYQDAHAPIDSGSLKELVDLGIDVKILGCQPKEISSPDVDMGLTEPVEEAVPKAVEIILQNI